MGNMLHNIIFSAKEEAPPYYQVLKVFVFFREIRRTVLGTQSVDRNRFLPIFPLALFSPLVSVDQPLGPGV